MTSILKHFSMHLLRIRMLEEVDFALGLWSILSWVFPDKEEFIRQKGNVIPGCQDNVRKSKWGSDRE